MSERSKGIGFIILAAFCFSLMTVFIRLSGDLPTTEKTIFRNLVAIFVSFFMLKKEGDGIQITKKALPDLTMRALFGTVGIFCNFYAIDHLNISDANMLNKLSPFFAMLMSIFILKEKANKTEWASFFIAFVGAVLVIKPGFSVTSFAGLIGLIGGFGAGIAYTFLRRLGTHGVKGPTIVLYFSIFSTVFNLPFFIADFKPMSALQLLFLLLTGAAATGGQFFITAAYTHAPAKDISVYDYTQVIFAAAWGFILFNQIPDYLSIIGYIIILSAAIIKFIVGRKK